MNDGRCEIYGSRIESRAYLSSKDIRNVVIGAGIEHIGDWAFAKCSNLMTVSFAGDHRPGLFGKDVFMGCARLGSISFRDTDDVTAALLAICTNKMYCDHLLRAEDVGQKSWYGKWDIRLVTELKSDDAEARMSAALCGEEDISYDGIGSVDGELPGETDDYVRQEEYRKCSLCYTRLLYNKYLSDATRGIIEDHLRANSFGSGNSAAFYSLFDDEANTTSYMRIYLDTVRHDKCTLKKLIEAVPFDKVDARSYLIRQSDGGSDKISELLL